MLRPADRHAAPEGRQPVAADRVDRQAEPRPPDRDPDDGDDDDQDDGRLGHPLVAERPGGEVLEPLRGAAARRVRGRAARTRPTRSAIARVTTMSGTRVTTTRPPLIAPSRRPSRRTPHHDERSPNSSLWPFISDRGDDARERHHRADREVDAAGDHDDRLGDGGQRQRQDEIARPWSRIGAVARLDDFVNTSRTTGTRAAPMVHALSRSPAEADAAAPRRRRSGRRPRSLGRPRRGRQAAASAGRGSAAGGVRGRSAAGRASAAAASAIASAPRPRPPRPPAAPRRRLRLYAARSSAGSSASAASSSRDDAPAEDHDRPIADELDLLELGRVEQDRRAGLGEVAQQHVDLVLGADVDAAGGVEAEHRRGRRRRPSGRSSPSAGCRPTGGGPRRRPGRRSGASRRRRRPSCARSAEVDRGPSCGAGRANGRAMFSRTERCISRASARSAAT